MRKFIFFLAIFFIFLGCEDGNGLTHDKDDKNSSINKHLGEDTNTTKTINQTIDKVANKAKILNNNFDNLNKNITKNVGKFIEENKDEFETIKKNTIHFLNDVNQSFELVKNKTSGMMSDANSTVEEIFSDINSTFSKPVIINNGDDIDLFSDHAHDDEIKQIVHLNPNLIQKVSIESFQNSLEITINGENPISESEFEELAKDAAKIIRKTKDSVKITIYYINNITKYSGKF